MLCLLRHKCCKVPLRQRSVQISAMLDWTDFIRFLWTSGAPLHVLHHREHDCEVPALTPAEWQKKLWTEHYVQLEWRLYTQHTSKMGKSFCAIDCIKKFNKKSELFFIDNWKLKKNEVKGIEKGVQCRNVDLRLPFSNRHIIFLDKIIPCVTL